MTNVHFPEQVEVTLAGSGEPLPAWAPGAHVEIELPNSLVRQFSLTGEPRAGRWILAVLLKGDGRGGSRFIHHDLAIGTEVRVKPPRNHFPLVDDEPVLLVAGGIGITPMIPMMAALKAQGREHQLVYLGRSTETMAYADELVFRHGDHALVWPADERGRFDLNALLAGIGGDVTVYCCGPERLIQAVEAGCEAYRLRFRAERFAPVQYDDRENLPFEIELRSTGEVFPVAADETILTVLGRQGVFVQSTCQEGTCGTCEVGVVDGSILHRDSVLTKEDRAVGDTMMVCVSRCAGKRLKLSL
ncbi:PDR/VanB family oxidoreductase [Sphingomonas sp. 2SG]|uniref:PDR/VanB family oxidoreductase n=1 Tax=Sphingomonas sp. 2SG TaxID=2502201 RepID=UPI0010F6AC90|nr:PDR/VanB family oxidoreductase [Sphingomonas sp. 2SG]